VCQGRGHLFGFAQVDVVLAGKAFDVGGGVSKTLTVCCCRQRPDPQARQAVRLRSTFGCDESRLLKIPAISGPHGQASHRQPNLFPGKGIQSVDGFTDNESLSSVEYMRQRSRRPPPKTRATCQTSDRAGRQLWPAGHARCKLPRPITPPMAVMMAISADDCCGLKRESSSHGHGKDTADE
jgi:hypothetical protein